MAMQSIDHSMMLPTVPNVTDNKSFIEYVIPHHQEAITSSQQVLKITKDPELISFLNNVIQTQSREVNMLKSYYKSWFGKEYVENGNYDNMMNLSGKAGLETEKAYIQGMLSHHSGIIDVAKKVLKDNKFQYKPEIFVLSGNIIKDQEADNLVLQKWLETKYK
jgi:uncharacterized protein (DUF305 family)